MQPEYQRELIEIIWARGGQTGGSGHLGGLGGDWLDRFADERCAAQANWA
jgi:hypothetical protein